MSDQITTSDLIVKELEKQLTAGQLQLPVLPQVAIEILHLANDVTADAAAFVRLISSDQVLAGHIMKVANSAAYGFGMKLTSLQQAVTRLGLQNIADIAMAATMGPRLFASAEFKPLINQLWRESLATAFWSREIARYLRQNVEAAFLSGLLHQIGKPIVLNAVVTITNKQNLPLDVESLIKIINEFYARIGVELAKAWRLPETVTECMRAFAGESVDQRYEDIVIAIKAAQPFLDVTFDADFDVQFLSASPVLMGANLYPDDIEMLLKKVDSIRSMLEAMTL
jgi:HD-like signal output (HDOD) protein